MTTKEKYFLLKESQLKTTIGAICLLFLESLSFLAMFFHPEYLKDETQYWISLQMDGSIILGLLIGLGLRFFAPRKIEKKLRPLAVVPVFLWFFFSGTPYVFKLILNFF